MTFWWRWVLGYPLFFPQCSELSYSNSSCVIIFWSPLFQFSIVALKQAPDLVTNKQNPLSVEMVSSAPDPVGRCLDPAKCEWRLVPAWWGLGSPLGRHRRSWGGTPSKLLPCYVWLLGSAETVHRSAHMCPFHATRASSPHSARGPRSSLRPVLQENQAEGPCALWPHLRSSAEPSAVLPLEAVTACPGSRGEDMGPSSPWEEWQRALGIFN